ncbi:hypothetical protein FH972_025977 [Carpinus fangiana]|uniref:Uncharacterized protein n=1 Tax=Carpinus fangiana TaxID=176857 RepID=A0A5N6L2Z4_9ROSI|nr:hypothetical protein FH972_025977 [Carpinus fangiana]
MTSRTSSFGFMPDRATPAHSTAHPPSAQTRLSSASASASAPRRPDRSSLSPTALTSASSLPRKSMYGQRLPVPARKRAPTPELTQSEKISPMNPNAAVAREERSKPRATQLPPRTSSRQDPRIDSGTTTPSLVSTSSVSTPDSPRKNVLRRKPSVIGTYIAQRRHKQTVKAKPEPVPSADTINNIYGLGFSTDNQPSSVLDRLPQDSSQPTSVSHHHSLASPYSSLDHHRPYQTPTPLSNPSVTPSLIFTDSPSGFSHRTTPTQYSSYSPHLNDSPQIGGNWFTPAKTNTPDAFTKATRAGLAATTRLANARQEPTSQPAADFTARNPSAQTERKEVASKDPRAPSPPPPELAHLMIDSTSSSNFQSSSESSDGDRRSRSRHAAQGKLPRLDTSLGRKPTSDKSPPTAVKDKTPTSAPTIRRKPVEASAKTPNSAAASTKSKRQTSLEQAAGGASAGDAQQKSASRFGIFSRKKTVASASSDDVSKLGRKGPVAGTGYEGLGKYAGRRRSGGSTSVSAASGSRKSDESSLDDFLQQRLNPVYLRGDGNASEPRGRTSESTVDEDPSGTVFSSPGTAVSSQSSMGTPYSAGTTPGYILDHAKSIDAQLYLRAREEDSKRPSTATASLGLDEGGDVPRPSTAGPTLSVADSDTSLWEAMPRPLFAQNVRNSRTDSIDSEDDSINLKRKTRSIFAKTSSSKIKSTSKWNLFQRSRTSLEETEAEYVPELPNFDDTIRATPKPTAHYACFDNPAELDFEDLQSIMEEADRAYWDHRPNRSKSTSTDGLSASPVPSVPGTFRIEGSPRIPPAVPEQVSTDQHPPPGAGSNRSSEDREMQTSNTTDTARPSRLAQVGRIPRVVSKRDRERQLPSQSFSRPFVDTQQRPDHKLQNPPSASTAARAVNERSQAEAAAETRTVNFEPIDVPADLDELMPLPQSVPGHASPEKAFLAFKPRKDSQTSFSSNSGTSFIHTAAATAVLPTPGSPLSPDEVWNEYDDLIADVTNPLPQQKTMPEPGNSLAAGASSGSGSCFPFAAKGTPKTATFAPLPPTTLQVDTTAAANHAAAPSLLDLRNELRAMYSPGTGGPLPERLSAVESVTSTTGPKTYSLLPMTSMSSTTSSKKHRRGSSSLAGGDLVQPASPASSRSRSSIPADPMSMANLRFGALMVSKWLSFGRVLVSPAHFELENATTEERILIVDGLGKDWSYYCALTYSNAQVYSIGPWTTKASNRQSLGGGLDQLPNYRHFPHPDLGANMPFPKGFFSVVVVRFPAATTDSALSHAVAECKRVLRPGGYIEISTLDLDLNNMGNKARREVRELKTKIHASNPCISLKSASDNMQYLLGRKGFDNLNRCFVGVPAAGVVSESGNVSRDEKNVGIMELMEDSSEQGDRDITKMVAKVGRWWYSRCYEQEVLPDGDLTRSMWTNKALLRECESMSTSFKLLICYAQKPTVAKRRAVSL